MLETVRSQRLIRSSALLVVALALAVIVGGCARATSLWAQQEPSRRVSAEKLADDYSLNLRRADEAYKDRLLEVTGTVKSVSHDVSGTPFIMLGDVQCVLASGQEYALEHLLTGRELKLEGVGDGEHFGIPVVDECVFVGGELQQQAQ